MGQSKGIIVPEGYSLEGVNKLIKDPVVPVDPAQVAEQAAEDARKAVEKAANLAEAAGVGVNDDDDDDDD